MCGINDLQSCIEGAFNEIIVQPLEAFLESVFGFAINKMVGTPSPDNLVTPPTDGKWEAIYEVYETKMLPIALILLVFAYTFALFMGSISTFLSQYDISRLNRRLVLAGLGSLGWWQLGSIALNFSDGLGRAIAPNPEGLTDIFFGMLVAVSGALVIGAIVWSGSIAVIAAVFILYQLRNIVLYTYMFSMPVLFSLWAVDISFLKPVSSFSQRLMKYFVPALFFTIPSAFILQTGEVMIDFGVIDEGADGLLGMLMALLVPAAAIIAPKYFFQLPGQSGISKGRRKAQRAMMGGSGGGGGGEAYDDETGRGGRAAEEAREGYGGGGQRRPRDFSIGRAKRRWNKATSKETYTKPASKLGKSGVRGAAKMATMGSKASSGGSKAWNAVKNPSKTKNKAKRSLGRKKEKASRKARQKKANMKAGINKEWIRETESNQVNEQYDMMDQPDPNYVNKVDDGDGNEFAYTDANTEFDIDSSDNDIEESSEELHRRNEAVNWDNFDQSPQETNPADIDAVYAKDEEHKEQMEQRFDEPTAVVVDEDRGGAYENAKQAARKNQTSSGSGSGSTGGGGGSGSTGGGGGSGSTGGGGGSGSTGGGGGSGDGSSERDVNHTSYEHTASNATYTTKSDDELDEIVDRVTGQREEDDGDDIIDVGGSGDNTTVDVSGRNSEEDIIDVERIE